VSNIRLAQTGWVIQAHNFVNIIQAAGFCTGGFFNPAAALKAA
jgi:hypothetical protein